MTYVSSDVLDWKYVLVTPYRMVTNMLSGARMGIVLIGAVLALLCGVLAFGFSKRLHRPIDDIRTKLSQLEAERRRSGGERKQQYLRTLLEAPGALPDKQQFAEHKIVFRPDSAMSVILFQIDNYKEFCTCYQPSDQSLFLYGIANIMGELGNARFPCEPVEISGGRIALLCCGQQGEDAALALEALIAEIQKNVSEYLNISLSAAVSLPGESAADLPELYREADEGIRYRLFYGHQCRIFYKDVERRPEKFSYPYDHEKRLSELLLSGKADEAFEIYLEIIVGASEATYDAFNLTLLRLDLVLQSVIDQLGRAVKQDIQFDNHTFLNLINSRETIEEINVAFSEKYHLIEQMLEHRRSSKHEAVATRVMELIDERYADSELTLASLADEVDLPLCIWGDCLSKSLPRQWGNIFTQFAWKTPSGCYAKTLSR